MGTLGGGLGTLGVNLNLVSSSKLRLRLRLSFIIGRVGTLGGRAGNPGGGAGLGPCLSSSARNVPRCTP